MIVGCSTAGRRFAEATPDDAGRSTVVAAEAGKPVEVGAGRSTVMAEESTVEESTAVATSVHRTADLMTVGAEAEPKVGHTDDTTEAGKAEADERVETASLKALIACPVQAPEWGFRLFWSTNRFQVCGKSHLNDCP